MSAGSRLKGTWATSTASTVAVPLSGKNRTEIKVPREVSVSVRVIIKPGTHSWPLMCPCCGRSLEGYFHVNVRVSLGVLGNADYSANVPYCRKCADHVVQGNGGSLAPPLDLPEIALGRRLRSGRKLG